MVQRSVRFSSLDIPANAVPDTVVESFDLTAGGALLRAVFTMERNVWQVVCEGGSAANYVPGKKWDGIPVSNSIEDKPSNVTWQTINSRLLDLLPADITPAAYVRLLFWALRGRRDMPPPSPVQLYAAKYVEIALSAKKHACRLIKISFISQVTSLRSGTIIRHRGQGLSELRSLYQTLISRDNGYTPLFVHVMASTTTNSMRATDLKVGDTKYVELLDKLSDRTKIAAALEYTVFPEHYDTTWGAVLSPGLSATAGELVSKIVASFAA